MKLKKNVKIILSIIVILCALTLFKIFYDEPLLASTKDWMQNDFIEKNSEENAFYYLIGFACLKNNDPYQIGYNWVIVQNNKTSIQPDSLITDFTNEKFDEYNHKIINIFGIEKIDTDEIRIKLFDFEKQDFMNYLVNNKTFIDSMIISYDFLIKRYDELDKFQFYENTLLPSFYANPPMIASLVDIKRLKLANIGLNYRQGNKQEALLELQNEIDFSKYFLLNTQSLIGQILATFCYKLDLNLLSLLIDEPDLEKFDFSFPDNLSVSEADWKTISNNIFKESMSTVLHYLKTKDLSTDAKPNLLKIMQNLKFRANIKINKLTNFKFQYYNFLYFLSSLHADDFYHQYLNFPKTKTNFLDKIFDKEGYILNNIPEPRYYYAIAKYHDLSGYLNLLKAKQLIKQKQINSNVIIQFLEKQKDLLFDPYTKERIKWDAEKSIIYFDGLDEVDEYNIKKLYLQL